jgi:hypothetical protein
MHDVEVAFNGMNYSLNFMKMHLLDQKLLLGDTKTDRRTDGRTDRTVIPKPDFPF